MQVVFITTSIGRQLLFPSLFGATHKTLPEGCQRTSTGQSAAPIGNVHGLANFPRRRSTAGLPAIGMEVWGFEPQTYGLQSHRSSHLSYTPPLVLKPERSEPTRAKGVLVVYLPPRCHPGTTSGFATKGERREPAIVTGCLE